MALGEIDVSIRASRAHCVEDGLFALQQQLDLPGVQRRDAIEGGAGSFEVLQVVFLDRLSQKSME